MKYKWHVFVLQASNAWQVAGLSFFCMKNEVSKRFLTRKSSPIKFLSESQYKASSSNFVHKNKLFPRWYLYFKLTKLKLTYTSAVA